MAGTGAVTASMAVLAVGAATASTVLVVAGLVLSGAGNGISRPPFTEPGIASAAQNVSGQIGAAVGTTVLTAVYASTGGDFATAFWVGTGFSAVAVVLAWLIQDLDRSASAEAEDGAAHRPAAPDGLGQAAAATR